MKRGSASCNDGMESLMIVGSAAAGGPRERWPTHEYLEITCEEFQPTKTPPNRSS